MITSTLAHTESYLVENVIITSHIDSHGVTPRHTETHRLTTCQKSNDNVHIDSHRVTPSHAESHRVRNVMITSTLTHTESHLVTPDSVRVNVDVIITFITRCESV